MFFEGELNAQLVCRASQYLQRNSRTLRSKSNVKSANIEV